MTSIGYLYSIHINNVPLADYLKGHTDELGFRDGNGYGNGNHNGYAKGDGRGLGDFGLYPSGDGGSVPMDRYDKTLIFERIGGFASIYGGPDIPTDENDGMEAYLAILNA